MTVSGVGRSSWVGVIAAMVCYALLVVAPVRGDTCPVAVSADVRIDCGYSGITEGQCAERGCCWGPGQPSEVPECYYPGAGVPIKVVHVIQVGGGACVGSSAGACQRDDSTPSHDSRPATAHARATRHAVPQACHLDVGFKEMAHDIVNLYFDTHFPHAIEWAQELRAAGGAAQLKFMTQSYLVSLFMDCPAGMGLHCPNASYVADFTVRACCLCHASACVQSRWLRLVVPDACVLPCARAITHTQAAVKRGDIYWHAFPFEAELEAMSADEVAFGVRLTHDLDKRFGACAPRARTCVQHPIAP